MAFAYSGVWRGGSEGHYLWANAGWDNFKAKWQELSGAGLRLVDVETYQGNGPRLWAGAWRAGTDAHYLWVNAPWDNFKAKWQELSNQGLRLNVLRTYGDNPRLWAGVWRAGSDGHYLWVNAPWDNFKAKWQELSGQGLRLVDIETYVVGGQRLWAGAWRASSDGHYLWVNASWDNFKSKWQELAGQGLRLSVFRAYGTNPTLYAGVWRAGNDPHYLWANASWENFKAKWQELGAQNLRLINMQASWVGLKPTVRLHAKVLTAPNISIDTMVSRMREVYESVGIEVALASTENLNLPTLNDCDVGACVSGQVTAEQSQLFANRNNAGTNDLVVYFVRSTVPPFNGCAAHPAGQPGAVVVQGATQWTLAHEVGHVLGLPHVNNNDRLMTGNGTANITNPPPDLITSEVSTMAVSPFTIDL
jgi:hypothetical protein